MSVRSGSAGTETAEAALEGWSEELICPRESVIYTGSGII